MRCVAAIGVPFIFCIFLAVASAQTPAMSEHPSFDVGLYDHAESRVEPRIVVGSQIPELQVDGNAGNAEAQYLLGTAYENGYGVIQNYVEAVAWYRKAAEQGFVQAQNNLGHAYHHGTGVLKDYNEALKWYRAAAEKNDRAAQNNLGYMYASGHGVRQSYNEAALWYRKAADQGHAAGQTNLANMFYRGTGVAQDFREAAKWFSKAARAGFAPAQNCLASLYESGRGVRQDPQQAIKWYRASADQSNATGENNLGYMFFTGSGTQRDHREAAKWFLRSAKHGYVFGQANAGFMYAAGEGVPLDYAEAYMWFSLASDQGDTGSAKAKGKIRAIMTETQVREGERRARASLRETVSKSLPFKLYGGYLIVVEGQIGRLEHLKFALDTGASSSIIDRKIAQKVALAQQQGHTSQFGKPVSNQWILTPDLRFGPIRVSRMYLPTADLSAQHLPTHVDAVIGVDVLNLSSFTIDYDVGNILFGSIQGPKSAPKLATVEIFVQGRPLRVVVDTGAKELILYLDRIAARVAHITLVSELSWTTIGSSVYAYRAKLPGVRLGGVELDENCLLLEEPSTASPVDGYLGVAALRAKRVEFDLRNGAFRWTPIRFRTSIMGLPLRYSCPRLSLAKNLADRRINSL